MDATGRAFVEEHYNIGTLNDILVKIFKIAGCERKK